MRVIYAAAMVALLAGPAGAQFGAKAKDPAAASKSPQEIAAERAAEKAYKKSLSNIPDQGPTDPWGAMRSDNPPKEPSPAKRAATGSTKN